MLLRISSPFEQGLADMCAYAPQRFAGVVVHATVESKTHRGLGPECFSTTKQTLSYDGQQASPSALLSVSFRADAKSRREGELNRGSGVVFITKTIRGSRSWVFLKSFWHSRHRQVLRLAEIISPNRPLVAQLSALVPLSLPAVACCKAQPSVRAQTSLHARPNWSAVSKLSTGVSASIITHCIAASGSALRGILRFSNLFHYHKGPEYVQ